MDPYGGPHAQRVMKARNMFLSSQWLADQGFCVVVADGRGTPGRGQNWERSIYGDFAQPALDDQVEVLENVVDRYGSAVDQNNVGIRGWSFGGYLAALAVLRRPDKFHAAIAGAPVTDWELYDTHYTERYLGTPSDHPENFERTSLIRDAHRLERPLLIIHGLADDNVIAAHSLQLSSALLAAGRRVIGVDLLHQSELLDGETPVRRQRSLPGEQGFGGWTYCYNLPLFAHRVHDILAVIEMVRQEDESQAIDIIGLGEAGPLVAAALVQCQKIDGTVIDRAVIDTGGFRFAQLTDVYDARFLPGAVKYGDIPGLLSLVNSNNLWLAGESLAADSIVKSAWRSRENPDRLTVYQGRHTERDALQWLLK